MDIEGAHHFFEHCVAAGGPRESQYPELLEAIDQIHRNEHARVGYFSERNGSPSRLDEFLNLHPEIFRSTNTLQGFAWCRPHGYSGDYEMINLIYANHVSTAEPYSRWDNFFQAGRAPQAVRNRAEFLRKLIGDKSIRSMISVGSGPAHDIKNALGEHPYLERVALLDNDPGAIAYSRDNLAGTSRNRNIAYIRANALRWVPDDQFEFVWCSGLFDYLSERPAVFMLKRLRLMARQGGAIVVGNFGRANPSRGYMESIGDWYLFHRTEEEMAALAKKAGFKAEDVTLHSDETGVNLFMYIACH